MTISSEIDERTLRELYLVPFEAAVRRAGVRVGHDRLQPAQRHVLQRAPVAADRACCATSGASTASSSATGSARHSAAASLLAGLDLEMPGPPRERGEHLLRRASTRGEVDRATTSTASVARLLALAEWTGAADDRHGRGHRRRPGDTMRSSGGPRPGRWCC